MGASRWLKHVTMVLRGAVRIAQLLDAGEPVLVHCSDGWDRTSQLSALGQLLVDPYYRTIDGFAALVEKDWCVSVPLQCLRRAGVGRSGERSLAASMLAHAWAAALL